MFISSTIGIIADDLTGANDTALQFHMRGCNTQIILDYNSLPDIKAHTQAWALSTESRNTDAKTAKEKVKIATENLIDNFNIEYFYKKIDSTIRGNIAPEVLGMLDILGWDAAIIMPAFPNEGRITVGGYHLWKGVPIERTELARDPHSPIYESHIPTLLKSQLEDDSEKDLVDLIELETVMKGAGPILMKLKELINKGKKLIVVDAVSTVDIEQVILAMEKCNFKILPCGSAGAAQALGNAWLPEMKYQHITKTIPVLPKLIISGSSTDLTASQLKKLADDDDIENTYFIELKLDDILKNNNQEVIERAVRNLVGGNVVVIHSSNLIESPEKLPDILFENELTKKKFASMIGDFLAEVTKEILAKKEVILISVGGETSYKCCKAIDSGNIQLIDEVAPAIPLSIDHKAQWIVTKSGNLGNPNTLIEVIKYFEQHK
ncbi:MAG: four-carbon acid sugar kinase family protein [Candidatus Gastranaerophilales bacterium]|nr:four-carbon acid sugar kinase family protein [Candidatus Gastranaerophilales bacterium]